MISFVLLGFLAQAQNVNPLDGLTVGIESATSFCLIIPAQAGDGNDTNYIARTEKFGVAACTSNVPAAAKPTKQLPDGLIKSAHFISNQYYSQVTGLIDPTAYGLNPLDQGTQYDDSLASQGGVLPDSGCGGYQQYLEYFGANIYCIRCCNYAFSYYCDPSQDTRGCWNGIPGDYDTPGFTNNGQPVYTGSAPSTFGSAPMPIPNYVPDWAQCAPATDLCATSGFTCCQSPEDASVGNGKTTCRAPGYCASQPGPNPYAGAQPGPGPIGGTGGSSSNNVAAWSDCTPGFSACPNGYMCCVAPGDSVTSKNTCRLSGLAANNPSGCYVPATITTASSTSSSTSTTTTSTATSSNVPAWNVCTPGSSVCPSGYTCCVAPADVSSSKYTCRLSGLAANAPSGCYAETTSSSTSPPSPSVVADWNDCNPTSDTCSTGFSCCVAPGDVGSGKTTCRAAGYCASGIAPGGALVAPDWNDCRIGTDTCASAGFTCCIAPNDIVSGKSTCRPPGFCS